MHLPFYYMLKTSVCLAATGIFYLLLLRRLTQYTCNRWFLLAGTLLSFIIPLVNFSTARQGGAGSIFYIIKTPAINSVLPQAAEKADNFQQNIQWLFLLLFVVTALVLLAKFAMQVISLKKITAKARLISAHDVLLYNVDDDIAPFSFNNSIYINKNMYSAAELEEVIRHEMVHVKQKHTIDVIVAELACILNWYNPFAWLLKNAIKQNLEFIADDVVLQHTQNHKAYQYLLLKVTGSLPLGIANNLNVSCLKNRIVMMNKAKTPALHMLRLLFIIPLALVLLPALMQAQHAGKNTSVYKAAMGAGDMFTLGTLTYAISDANVETLVKKEQNNSFLKPGSELSLSSIQNEKLRLTSLLQNSGYDTSGSHAVYFEVDTFSTAKSFSIQVTINVQRRGSVIKAKSNVPGNGNYPHGATSNSTNNKNIQAHGVTGFEPAANEQRNIQQVLTNTHNARM